MNSQIIDVIAGYPEVGMILAEHGVGCVTCQVGTCLLKDVVAIHGLSPEAEESLKAGIAAAVASAVPGANAATTLRETEAGVTGPAASPGGAAARPAARPPVTVQIKYSLPIGQLVDEHRLIQRWVAQIPAVVRLVDLEEAADRELIGDGIDFIRSYADRFHHAKEEDILFGYFDRESPAIRAFVAEHDAARRHVRQAEVAVEAGDRDAVAEHLAAYGELLSSHIEREDEVLYPWMDRELTTSQIGELHSRFAALNEAAGPRFTKDHTAFVERIERWTESETKREEAATKKVEATL